jgi:hypothetical protein
MSSDIIMGYHREEIDRSSMGNAYIAYLQEDDIRVMAHNKIRDGLHPSIHRNVLIGPDVVRHELDLHIRL